MEFANRCVGIKSVNDKVYWLWYRLSTNHRAKYISVYGSI